MFKKLKYDLLASFFLFTMLSVVVILINKQYLKHKQNIESIKESLDGIHHKIVEDFVVVSDFLNYETINPEFYKNKKSDYLSLHEKKQYSVEIGLFNMLHSSNASLFDIDSGLYSIKVHFLLYAQYFHELTNLIYARGFRDYGLIGEMRDYAHLLEDNNVIPLGDLLMLRRHEKDYLLRNDPVYVQKFKNKTEELQQQLGGTSNKETLRLLKAYLAHFNKVVKIDQRSGFRDNTALKARLDTEARIVTEMISGLKKEVAIQENIHLTRLKNRLISIYIFIVMAGLFLSFWLAEKVTRRVSILSKGMCKFIASGFKNRDDGVPAQKNEDEIGVLLQNYQIMKTHIIELIESFEQKVEERTFEISQQKTQIEKQNEEILAQRDEVVRQKQFIEIQKKVVEEKNTELMASIRYAKNIQDALIPDQDKMQNMVKESFLFHFPLNVVSGDFFWMNQICHQEKNNLYFAIADCTGHGIPGALVSMLGIASLNEVILRKSLTSIAEIMHELRTNFITTLQQSGNSGTYDGMDIALAMIDYKKHRVHFSGANQSVYILRKNELYELKGDRMPIGRQFGEQRIFQEYTWDLEEGDLLYAFSDGYVDQFGGERNKKYSKKRLRKKLAKWCSLDLQEQKYRLIDEFIRWKGKTEQIDDVIFFGMKYTGKN